MFWCRIAAVPAYKAYRAHDGLRRTIVPLDPAAKEFDAAASHIFKAAVNAAQWDGRNKSAVNVIETDNFEIVYV